MMKYASLFLNIVTFRNAPNLLDERRVGFCSPPIFRKKSESERYFDFRRKQRLN